MDSSVWTKALNHLVPARKCGFIPKLFPGSQAGSSGAHLPPPVPRRPQASHPPLDSTVSSFTGLHRINDRGYSHRLPPIIPSHAQRPCPCEMEILKETCGFLEACPGTIF